MLVVDHLQGGADHMPATHHDSDDEEALHSIANASTAYGSVLRLQVIAQYWLVSNTCLFSELLISLAIMCCSPQYLSEATLTARRANY